MKNHPSPNHGFTLIDLLVSLSLFALTVSFVFNASDMLEKHQVDRQARGVLNAINYGRSQAIKQGKSVFICPSKNGSTCDRSWSTSMLVYQSSNDDKNFDAGDTLLYRFDLTDSGPKIKWGSFRKKHYLELLPTGMTNYQNGTYTVCAESKNPDTAIPVIVNVAGRPYFGKDRNGDGVREYSSGNAVSCG